MARPRTHPAFQRRACPPWRHQLPRRWLSAHPADPGARSSLERAKRVGPDKATPEQVWIRSLACRMPFGKVIVAIANKHARQRWAMLANDVDYDPHAYIHHPLQQHAAVT